MREYARIAPTFWTRGSGKRLRGDLEAQVVALYLMTSPVTSMVGIFPLSLPTLCNDTGLTLEGARKGLARVSQEALAYYDEEDELVWVPALPKHQLGERMSAGRNGKPDNKVIGIKKALAPFKGHRFYDQFLERYGESYLLHDLLEEGASEGLRRGPARATRVAPAPAPAPELGELEGFDETERRSEPRAKPADPFGDTFRGKAPEQRADVAQVHERWKASCGFPKHKFRQPYDLDAKAIAQAIDSDGLENCLIVADYAPNDGMVNGKLDENRQKHDRPEYIFGKSHVFHRILKAALAAGRGGEAPKKLSASEAVARAKAVGGES